MAETHHPLEVSYNTTMRPFKNHLLKFTAFVIFIAPFVYYWQDDIAEALAKLNQAPPPTTNVSWLHTSGTQILTESNEPILLRGVNISSNNWSDDYAKWHPQAVTAAVYEWNANVIRTRVFQNDFISNPNSFFTNLEREIINPARQSNAYVIIHPWIEDNASLPNDQTVEMWKAIANRYANDPTIIYDLLAEPRDITHQELRDAYTRLIPVVRHQNPKALIMVTGTDWGRDVNYWLDDPLPFDNLVYRSNPYNRVGEFEGLFTRIALQHPVFLGEFGADESLTMDLDAVKKLISLSQQLNIGWTAWNFSSSGCPCLLSDESTFTPSTYGQIVKQTLDTNEIRYDYPEMTITFDPTRFDIYSDFLDNGFSDFSWGIDRKLIDTTDVYRGNHALSVRFTPRGGFFLRTTRVIPTRQFKNFTFHLKTPTVKPFIIRFRDHIDQLSDPINLTEIAVNTPNWQRITIPTSAINLESISGFMIETTPEFTQPQPLILDEIYLSR
jgi:endoglucanase